MTVTTSEYSKLRHAAEARARRLENAGFDPGYRAPKAGSLTPDQIKSEYKRLERWMSTEKNTLKGRRAAAAESAAKAEARRARERERYAEKRRAAGQEYKPRPPKSQVKTPEQKREQKREYNRRYRERQRQQQADLRSWLENLKGVSPTEYNAMRNLLSGLQKYGIKVRTPAELQQWAAYIKERDHDRKKQFYEFDLWLDEAETKTGKSAGRIRGEDVADMMKDFEQWKSNMDHMTEEFLRERMPNEYTQDQLGSLWAGFMATV